MRLCHKSVVGTTDSPRTEHNPLKIRHLAVRPEPVEGQTANYDTVSMVKGKVGMNRSGCRTDARNRGEGD